MASLVPGLTVELKESATLNWTIDEFAQVVRLVSPVFSQPNSDNQFQFTLHQDNSHIFLWLNYKGHIEEGYFYYTYSILDANGAEHHTREFIWNYNSLYCHATHLSLYVSRDQFEQLLVNGSLVFHSRPLQIDSFDNLSQNFEALLESGKLTDFIVLVGDKQFRVHRAILASQSAVFAAMFDHDETQEVKEGRVVVEDVQVEVFELMIRYIYTGKVDLLGEYADELLVAADKYQLDLLKSACEESLISTLTIGSVCGILLLSDMRNAEQLKSKCIEYIVNHSKEVMLTKGWKELANSKRNDLIAKLFEKLANSITDE